MKSNKLCLLIGVLFALLFSCLNAQAADAPLVPGSKVTLTATADGTPPMSWQWYKNGTAIAGATTDVLLFATLGSTDAGEYTVRATNEVGSAISAPSTIKVGAPPSVPIITITAVKPSQVQVTVPAGTSVKINPK